MDNNKKEILIELEKHNGIVSSACKSIGLPRSTFYNWKEADPEFYAAVEDIQEVAIDFVESKLMENISENDVGSIIFYLKTKGKKRGYVERSEVDHTTKGESINPTPITFSKKNG